MIARVLFNRAASVANALRTNNSSDIWHLRSKRVCASTEIDLSRWVKEKPYFNGQSRAVLAMRQTFGKGQYARKWDSPFGGIWLSAAIPCDVPMQSSGLFGLAVAVSVAETFQKNFVPVKLKWPNDLIVEDRKLAGFLPRIVTRGNSIEYARVGIGINVRNRVSKKAISLSQVLDQKNISISEWTARILVSLEQTRSLMRSKNLLCKKAEKFLLKSQYFDKDTGEMWNIKGLNTDGSLFLRRGLVWKSLYHWD